MNLAEKKKRRADLLVESRTIAEKAKTESNRALTPEERTAFDAKFAEIETLGRDIETDERFERLQRADTEARGNAGGRVSDPMPHTDPNNVGTRHSYSVLKAIRQRYNERIGKRDDVLDGLEYETHQELAKRKVANQGRAPQGVMIPWDLRVDGRSSGRFAMSAGLINRRNLDTTAGVGSIATILDATMIDLLRNRLVVERMGATVLSDMEGGTFAIPRQNAAGTMYWVAEGSPITVSNQTIDNVSFTPKTAGAATVYSRRFAEQTNQDAEMFARNDLTKITAIGIDLAGLNGSGSSNQPLGIQQNSSIPTVAIGTNGGNPTWAMITQLESTIATANADMGKLGYVLNAKLRGTLKNTPKVGSTFPVFMWDGNSPEAPINGYPAGVTNQLLTNLSKGSASGTLTSMLFGNWEDLIIAFWSGLDVIVDPYTGVLSGNIQVVVMQDCDINVRHPESFVKCVDILP